MGHGAWGQGKNSPVSAFGDGFSCRRRCANAKAKGEQNFGGKTYCNLSPCPLVSPFTHTCPSAP
ncbi:hypothetical protein H6H03_23925 [Nostoc paludosum FACHB-159]|uniref:Uncharacterized protein n=1 Tax=Nostoc paludosum FACHB-159 TaxID=2692908 RepID=A0ABR8KDI5_9NOSO|nr:hypothetical protein [Nostoc paludosum FACHB-159]